MLRYVEHGTHCVVAMLAECYGHGTP
jgi:hypothetical protein